MNKQTRILVCPLDWGLGHASRCIPIIKQLLLKDTSVIIAGSGGSLELLKSEFPEIEFVLFDGYKITYPRKGNMAVKMLFKLPSLLKNIVKEHRAIKKIIKDYKIDAVISDNRYGLFSKQLPTIFITHQLMIKCPTWLKFIEPLLYLINNFFISKYTECWVPDYKGKINLSGDLSHKYYRLQNVIYIGPQSRFYNTIIDNKDNKEIYDLMIILSGPEPQRSILEDIVIKQLFNKDLNVILVLGKPEVENIKRFKNNFTIYSYLTSNDLIKYINRSRLILCRSGYSSIMDLCVLGKKAILVPTPGQTEQEYLARFFMKKRIFYSQIQQNLNICEAIKKTEEYDGLIIKENVSLLNVRIDELLENIRKRK